MTKWRHEFNLSCENLWRKLERVDLGEQRLVTGLPVLELQGWWLRTLG
jgi:hypothetical protein